MKLDRYKTGASTYKQTTICYLVKDNQILLAMKKRGFGVNWWNGAGGKVKEGESTEEGAIRETAEEINVIPTSMEKIAILNFHLPDKQDLNVQTHVYRVTKWQGEPTESEEMAPRWFDLSEIPYDQMWDSDRIWMPKFLEGKPFTANFLYKGEDKLVEYEFTDNL